MTDGSALDTRSNDVVAEALETRGALAAASADGSPSPRSRRKRVEAPADSFLSRLVEKTVPSAVQDELATLIGSTMPAREDASGYDISIAGRFNGSQTVELLTHVKTNKLSGALLIGQHDEERVLYFSCGSLVGAASTVIFETLGRTLFQAGVLTREDSRTLVDAEEHQGPQSLLMWISSAHLHWAVERRAWEVVAGVCLVKRGHFVFIDGEPVLEGPTVYLDPVALGREGKRREDEWTSGASSDGEVYSPPSMGPPPPKIARKLRPIHVDEDTMGEILTRIREAETGPV